MERRDPIAEALVASQLQNEDIVIDLKRHRLGWSSTVSLGPVSIRKHSMTKKGILDKSTKASMKMFKVLSSIAATG